MIKKIFLGLLLVIIALAILIAGYIFSIKVDRPIEQIETISVLHKDEHRDNATQAEQWLETLYQQGAIPSLSVSIGTQGVLTWEAVIGYSDLSSGDLADLNTQYRIGSISKPITAAAIMRMQEENLISIDSTFGTYAKDYPAENSGFTIKQLLAHQGGVRHYLNEFSENFSTKEYSTTREAAAIVEKDALLFSPGEGFNYSTYGYTLLSLAMETAYSIPFEDIMQKEVFLPAGMTATGFDRSRFDSPRVDRSDYESQDNVASPYLHLGESFYRSPDVNMSYKYAGGGYLSTPSDLVRFGNALLNNTLLTPDSKEVMWSPVALNNGDMNPENYALGFRVGQDDLGRFVHHGGKSIGGYSFLLIYPEANIVVAFASNVTPSGNSFDRLKEAKILARLFAQKK